MEPKLGSVYLNIRINKTVCQGQMGKHILLKENPKISSIHKDKSSDQVKEVGLRNAIKMMLNMSCLTSSKWVSLKYFLPISVLLTLSKPLPSVSTNL